MEKYTTVDLDHLKESKERIERLLAFLLEGGVPRSIEVAMVVTPLRLALRAVYGSDMRAALALLANAIMDWLRTKFWLYFKTRSNQDE